MNAFPKALEQQLREEARRRYPREAAGLLVRTSDGLTFVPGRNVSAEPERASRLHPDDYERAAAIGEVAFHFHSHTNEPADPSLGDRVMSEKEQLPLVIVSWPAGEVRLHFPDGYRAPLLGRPFVHGLLDCYTAVRDYFGRKHGIELPDFAREDDWWLPLKRVGGELRRTAEPGEVVAPPANLYLDNLAAAGFSRVEGLRVDDCVLFQLGHGERGAEVPPNHAAVYVGDNAIYHHVAKRLSRVQPYTSDFGYYANHAYGIYRHRDLADRVLPAWRVDENA